MAAPMIIAGFGLSALFIGFVTLLQLHAPLYHHLLNELVLYGKIGRAGSSSNKLFGFRIKKRYFSHFYFIGVITNTSLLLMTVAICAGVWKVPSFLLVLIQMVFNVDEQNPEMHVSIDVFTTLLTLTVFSLHILRRLLETWYLHVFSSGSMNVLHYLVGVAFYPAVSVSILAESSTWSRTEHEMRPGLTLLQTSGLVLLVSASYFQHQTFRILASLRKNTEGQCQLSTVSIGDQDPAFANTSFWVLPPGGNNIHCSDDFHCRVKTEGHFIPRGTLFNLLSSPHYLMEILIYVALLGLQDFQNTTFYAVLFFVAVNQTMYGLLAHQWYTNKFEDYPRGRKAVIPFLL